MKIIFTFLIIILLSITVKAQEKTITRYFSIDSIEVSYEKFQKLRNSEKNMLAYFKNQNDTMFVKLVDRMIVGQISTLIVSQILAYFGNQKQSVDSKLPTVFQYFQGDDLCSRSAFGGLITSWDKKDIELKTYLKKKYKINFLNIKSNLSSIENRTNLSENWINDKYSMLKKFFPYHYPCGSFIILKPNGEYYINYGEYGFLNVLKGLKKIKVENIK